MRYDKLNRRTERLSSKLRERESEIARLTDQLSTIKQTLDSTLHEVRRFSVEISAYSEELSRGLLQAAVDARLTTIAQTVYYLAGMISSRLAFTDLELNPKAVVGQQTVRSGVYKKFDKSRHILEQRASKKGVRVRLIGTSRKEIDTLPAFELVPFVLLENAIKYSPAYQEVEIRFMEEPTNQLNVSVSSLGPMVDATELNRIFERGVRGIRVQQMSVPGEGLGLYLAKFLCDYHGIELSADSSQDAGFSLSDVPYSPFTITLSI